MRSGEAFSPFGEFFFSALAQSHQERLAQAVDQTDVASAPEAGLADHATRLAAQFAIDPLVVDVENASRSERAELATAERFDIYSGRNAGDSYNRQIVTIHVPFKGDPDLFRCQASTRTVCSRPVWLAGTEVCFDVPVPTHAPADIKGEVQRMLSCLKQNATSLAQEIGQFNQRLLASATSLLTQKRVESRERARTLDTLGLPLKKADASASASPAAGRTAAPAVAPQLGMDIFKHVFRVAFSFPGEARNRIGPIALYVREALGPDSVFYDEWYKAELARPNLDLRLQGIYTRAELVVACLCAGYERKEWCGLEWRPIRDLIKKRQDRIMLLRLDDADVAGSFSIDGYIDLRTHDDAETGALVVQRVTGARPQIAPRRATVVSGLPVEADGLADAPKSWEPVSEDLVIEITDAGHGLAIRLRNDGIEPVGDCRILLKRLDQYLPQKHVFTRNPFEPMTVLRAGKVQGGGTSHGFVFATWDADYRSTRFQADIPEQRSVARPELTGEGTWIAEFMLYQSSTALSTKTIFIALATGSKPALIRDPRLEGAKNEEPTARFAHLQGAHVRVTPVTPIACAQDKFYVRNVTSEAIELEKSSGHIISIPARRITDDLPVSDDAEGTRLLELNGRLQWLSLSRSWRFFPEKPQSADERQCGFSRAATPEDPIIAQLQQRGQNTRFARLGNLPRYMLQGYQLVYDEAGLCLRHGDLILIAAGV